MIHLKRAMCVVACLSGASISCNAPTDLKEHNTPKVPKKETDARWYRWGCGCVATAATALLVCAARSYFGASNGDSEFVMRKKPFIGSDDGA